MLPSLAPKRECGFETRLVGVTTERILGILGHLSLVCGLYRTSVYTRASIIRRRDMQDMSYPPCHRGRLVSTSLYGSELRTGASHRFRSAPRDRSIHCGPRGAGQESFPPMRRLLCRLGIGWPLHAPPTRLGIFDRQGRIADRLEAERSVVCRLLDQLSLSIPLQPAIWQCLSWLPFRRVNLHRIRPPTLINISPLISSRCTTKGVDPDSHSPPHATTASLPPLPPQPAPTPPASTSSLHLYVADPLGPLRG